MSVTLWASEPAPAAAGRAVLDQRMEDPRGIRPPRVERWVVDAGA
jgi:hypothetical protein